MKWFEQPHANKAPDKSKKLLEVKEKQEASEFSNETVETKKVIRQYGKAGEVSTGKYIKKLFLEIVQYSSNYFLSFITSA